MEGIAGQFKKYEENLVMWLRFKPTNSALLIVQKQKQKMEPFLPTFAMLYFLELYFFRRNSFIHAAGQFFDYLHKHHPLSNKFFQKLFSRLTFLVCIT